MYKVLIILMLICCSCSNTKYVEVPIEKISSVQNYKSLIDSTFIKDSIWIHDSVYIKEKGDTIFQYSYRDKIQYLYLDKVKRDTIDFIKIDTVTITKPVIQEKTVEVNTLYWWQKVLMGMGILSIIIGAIIIYLKFKK